MEDMMNDMYECDVCGCQVTEEEIHICNGCHCYLCDDCWEEEAFKAYGLCGVCGEEAAKSQYWESKMDD